MSKAGILAFLSLLCCGLVHSSSSIDLRNTRLAREGADGPPGLILEKTVFTEQFVPGRDTWTAVSRAHGMPGDQSAVQSNCRQQASAQGLLFQTEDGINQFLSRTGQPYQVSNEINKTFRLPPEYARQPLRASFKFAGKGRMEAGMVFLPGQSKKINRTSGNSGQLSVEEVVPEGAESVVVFVRLSDVGQILLTEAEVKLIAPAVQDELEILAFPYGYLDEQFFVPEKTPIQLLFTVKRDKKKWYKDVFLHLYLPEGYRCVGFDNALELREQQGGHYKIHFTKAVNATIIDSKYCCWRMRPILLQADNPPDGQFRPLRYQLEVGGRLLQERQLQLQTSPAVVAQRTPKRFITGATQPSGGDYDAAAAEAFLKLYQATGFNALQSDKSEPLNQLLQERGILRFSNFWYIRDGYPRGREPGGRPFIGSDGEPFNRQLCPVVTYRREPYYVEKLQSELTRYVVEKIDHYTVNWEAYISDYKGCFCEVCQQEFSAWSKLPAEEVAAVWPKDVVSKYHDQWVAFRSWQHGQIVRTVQEDVAAAGKTVGRTANFVPMVSVAGFYRGSKYCLQYHPSDYLKYLPMATVWGPYSAQAGLGKLYRYTCGLHLAHYYAVREVRRFCQENGGGQTKILGFPYGCHAFNVNTPEGVALETISNFLGGYAGSLVYWFFFDSRYWDVMAETNNLIACYEDMVLDGEPCDQLVSTTVLSEVIRPEHWQANFTSYKQYPELAEIDSPVVSQAFRQGDKMLVAAGNFWALADAFVNLQVKGLQGNLVLRQPHQGTWRRTSAEQLTQGITIHLPSLKWDFYLIEAWQPGQDYGREITAAEINQRWDSQRQNITAALAEEDKILAACKRISSFNDFDFSEVPEIAAGGVSLRELRLESRQALQITAPDYRIELEPARGGRVRSLVIRGQEAVCPNDELGFGVLGFWAPTRNLFTQAYRIAEITPEADHVQVVLERPDNGQGLKLVLSYQFFPDRLRETATVTNLGEVDQELLLRFHHLLGHLSRREGKDGSLRIGSEEVPIVQKHRFLQTGTATDRLLKTIINDAPVPVNGQTVEFAAPFFNYRLRFESATPLLGYYMWNHPGIVAGTFEPTYAPEPGKLKRGESRSISQEWTWY